MEPHFLAVNNRSLRREGLKGRLVGVFLVVDVLAIMGDESGVVKILAGDVERIRLGYSDSRHGTSYQTRVWRKGMSRPLLITLSEERPRGAYRDVARGFAGLVAHFGGLGRVERGDTAFWAWFPVVAFALLSAAAAGVGWFALENSLWWQRAMPAILPVALFVLTWWHALARSAPRPVKDLAELERQLP